MSIELSFDEAEKNEQAKFDLATEVSRLTRELAEAKARAIPDGWVPVPVEPTGVMLGEGAIRKLAGATVGMVYRAMIAARPEYPPNGLPSKESGNEDH